MIEEINFKLEQLGEYVSILREYQPYDIEEIRNNRTLRGAVDFYISPVPAPFPKLPRRNHTEISANHHLRPLKETPR
jgi:hypothetical protein